MFCISYPKRKNDFLYEKFQDAWTFEKRKKALILMKLC